MILDPNGSSFDNDKAHAFWHSDTGQSVLKVIKAATKDSGSGGGSDGTFVPNDPGHGGDSAAAQDRESSAYPMRTGSGGAHGQYGCSGELFSAVARGDLRGGRDHLEYVALLRS